jgi:hypothetical protein
MAKYLRCCNYTMWNFTQGLAMTLFIRSVAAAIAMFAAGASIHAATFNETINGDLSGNRAAPTTFNLTVGSNDLFATTQGGDLDVVTVNVPTGNRLSRLFLRSFTSAGFDITAFAGLQSGSTFTVDPNLGDPSMLLGYTHFGTGPGNVGADLLPSMSTAPGAIGFTPPLSSGPYSVFLQQLGTPNSYQLDFVVEPIPEPATIALCGAGLALIVPIARRRRALARD